MVLFLFRLWLIVKKAFKILVDILRASRVVSIIYIRLIISCCGFLGMDMIVWLWVD